MEYTKVIINPASAHGHTGKIWPEISEKLETLIGTFSFEFTQARGHAMKIAKDFLEAGGRWIFSIGGDGTLNEVVNSFFEGRINLYPDCALSVISAGTGGDFLKTIKKEFQITDILSKTHKQFSDFLVDTVVVTCKEGTRHFINMASFGLGGVSVERINRFKSAKILGGKTGYYLITLSALLTHRNAPVIVVAESGTEIRGKISNIAIANGEFQGGGMMMAPNASVRDGFLDIVVFGDMGILETMLLSKKIYSGSHINHQKIKVFRTPRLEIKYEGKPGRPDQPLDLDGETFGSAPALFEIIPASLKIRM